MPAGLPAGCISLFIFPNYKLDTCFQHIKPQQFLLILLGCMEEIGGHAEHGLDILLAVKGDGRRDFSLGNQTQMLGLGQNLIIFLGRVIQCLF